MQIFDKLEMFKLPLIDTKVLIILVLSTSRKTYHFLFGTSEKQISSFVP